MKSELPKVLHRVMGRSIITHVLNAARYLNPARLIVVTGYKSNLVETEVRPYGAIFVNQNDPRGTGQAVQCAIKGLDGYEGPVIILPGDVPLISPQTLIDLLDAHMALGTLLSVLTVRLDDPASYGRIIRDQNGWLERIVETRDASNSELTINEINSGIYVADCEALKESIFSLKPDNDQNEYYLTDVVAEFRARGHLVAAIEGPDPQEVQGINDRRELAMAQNILRLRINDSWLLSGVTMEDPATTYIEASVKLSKDVTLSPGVALYGATKVGTDAVIGPYCCLRNVEVGTRVILGAHLELENLSLDAEGNVENLDFDQLTGSVQNETNGENIRIAEDVNLGVVNENDIFRNDGNSGGSADKMLKGTSKITSKAATKTSSKTKDRSSVKPKIKNAATESSQNTRRKK
jgi:bifunctional UDP-N-acetylglucosamine pyrophosphorylase/glucosamine-1-phosphate N-acetyltransferase